MIRKALEILGAALVVLLTSCTGDAYQNVIPRGCTALMAIDMQEKTDKAAGDDAMPMAALFGLENIEQSGIDLSSTVYLFESPDGYFGLAASVRKASLVEQWMTDLQSKGSCKLLPERKGKRFAVLKESWMLAWDNDKLLVMGPVVATQQAELVVQMARYMQQPEKQSIKDTPIFQKLSEMQAPMAFVAQTAALPEALAAAFAIGAPQEADASQVMLAAEMEIGNGTLLVKGETFSFNKAIDQAIQASQKSLRPMNGKYLARLPQASLTWMSNVEGNAFYTLLEQNKALKGLLTGANVSFDFRQVVNGVDGDLIYMDYEGKRYTYKMIGHTIVDPSDVNVLVRIANDNPDKPLITLLTCYPLGTSRQRYVIYGEQINPSYEEAPSAAPVVDEGDTADTTMPQGDPSPLEQLWKWLTGQQ